MKSLHSRLDPIKEQVLAYTKNFGRFKAMQKFGVSTYTCFVNWLIDVTGDENFGLRPVFGCYNHQSLGDQLVEAFLHKIATLELENERLRKEIEQLRWLASKTEGKEEAQVLAIINACKA